MPRLGQALLHLDDQGSAASHDAGVVAVLVQEPKNLVKAGGFKTVLSVAAGALAPEIVLDPDHIVQFGRRYLE